MKNLFLFAIVAILPAWAQNVSPTIYQSPFREFGQPQLNSSLNTVSPNYVEGREFWGPQSIAVDNSSNPPAVYIVDTLNNRVLGFKNATGLSSGAYASIVIGQRDMYSTLPQGPSSQSSTLSSGFSVPSAVAVDASGNLYVMDAGNNRILRFPKPFSQTGSLLPYDLVIGQTSATSGGSANMGMQLPQAYTLAVFNGSLPHGGMALDSSGNLWVTDTYNNRVLRFPASQLAPGTSKPAADVVLGQTDFNTPYQQNGNSGALAKNAVTNPYSLAFAQSGDLYIADAYGRVLYYQGPSYAVGQAANRILGVQVQVSGQPAPSVPSQTSLGVANSGALLGVFTQGNNAFVCDTAQNRIMKYDVPGNWSAESATQPSPKALNVYGQVGFGNGQANQGNAQSSSSSFSGPTAGVFIGNTMWVVDSQNNRVMAMNPDSSGNFFGSFVLGQLDYGYNAPDLIEGKEVYFSAAGAGGPLGAGGLVIDKSSNPPHLYVADTGNNRVLGFKDARKVTIGTVADMVIGQPNFQTSVPNYPSGNALTPSATGLYGPVGLVVDNNGNLYVADSGNGRVVRFPAPFAQPSGSTPTANLVLGQSSLTGTPVFDASQSTMHTPFGLALFEDAGAPPLGGSLAVSDSYHNRVLIFKKQGADFVNGENASVVYGQRDFNTTTALGSGSSSGFNSPRHIASDTSDRLYVADSQDNRVMIFQQAPETTTNGATAVYQFGLSDPQGIYVSSNTGEVWVTNTGGNQIGRFPEFFTLSTSTGNPTAVLNSPEPLALTLDSSDNVLVAEASNRITFFYGAIYYRNIFSYNTQPLAPGMLAYVAREGLNFPIQDAPAQGAPIPSILGDTQVLISWPGLATPIAAPVWQILQTAVFFQVPMSAPTSGAISIIVIQNSTGQILGVTNAQMALANPGFASANATGTGLVVANNKDGTRNSPSNPAARGDYVTFCLTGQGFVPNGPPDGQGGFNPVATPVNPVLAIQGTQVSQDGNWYSGLGCGYPGLWQINATIPQTAAPTVANTVVLSMYSIPSNWGGNPQSNADGSPGPDIAKIQTTIWVK